MLVISQLKMMMEMDSQRIYTIFLKFVNQENIDEKIAKCKNSSRFKELDE